MIRSGAGEQLCEGSEQRETLDPFVSSTQREPPVFSRTPQCRPGSVVRLFNALFGLGTVRVVDDNTAAKPSLHRVVSDHLHLRGRPDRSTGTRDQLQRAIALQAQIVANGGLGGRPTAVTHTLVQIHTCSGFSG